MPNVNSKTHLGSHSPVIYMRGFPPTNSFPPGLFADLKPILALDTSVFEEFQKALSTHPAFLSRDALAKFAQRFFDEGVSRRIAVGLRHLHEEVAENGWKAVAKELGQVTRTSTDSPPIIAPEEANEFARRLGLILNHAPALDNQLKAERLARALGTPSTALEIICDFRPVFNETRDRIEGAIPLTTLRITLEPMSGIPDTCEVTLSYAQVVELRDKADAAERKLRAMEHYLAEKGTSIPQLSQNKWPAPAEGGS